MSYFAKVDQGRVVKVIVAESDFFDTYNDDTPGEWIETFRDGSERKNFARVGGSYDPIADVFYAEQPFESWTLNTETYLWEAPVAYPDDGELYQWNESTTSWDVTDFVAPE
jgi:hypothetical protein